MGWWRCQCAKSRHSRAYLCLSHVPPPHPLPATCSLPGQLDTLLGASRGICLDWKGPTGTGGTGGSYNFPNFKWPGSCPCSPQRPCLWPVCWSWRRQSGQLLVVWRLLLGGNSPSSPSLVCRAGPIASPLEPLLLALQPAGPLEEGLSLFFNKPLTISSSWASL